MAWEFKNGIPIYLQIVDGIKIRIAGGELPPGSKIPSVRDLAAEAGVNPNTMQRALTQLEQEGLLHAQRTSGRYVTEDEQKMKELRRSLSEKYVEELFTQLSRLGMTREGPYGPYGPAVTAENISEDLFRPNATAALPARLEEHQTAQTEHVRRIFNTLRSG